MKTIAAFFLINCLVLTAYSQRGKNGSYTTSSLNEQLNAYTGVTADATAGSLTVTVTDAVLTNTFFSNPLSQGDLVLIIQMQGATIDVDVTPTASWGGHYTVPNGHQGDWTTNQDLWGQVTDYNNAGKHELAEVASVAGGTIHLLCGLQHNYTASGHVQVIRVPRLTALSLPTGTSIIPANWNGTTGGVLALEVNGNVDLAAGSKLSASGAGFRGGVCDNQTAGSPPGSATNVTFCASDDANEGAEKGEGIGGFYAEYDALYSRYCKSAPANGGGGGGNHNSGGGGGANLGVGLYSGKGNPDPSFPTAWNLESSGFATSASSGGGRGGYSYATVDQNETIVGPANTAWSGDYRRPEGGLGGHPLEYDSTRLFMGGGGGAGDQNNLQGGNGGAGGGIIFLTVYGSISGDGRIESRGANGKNANPNGQVAQAFSGTKYGNDGAGGAGGGGYINIINKEPVASSLSLDAGGGDGGSQQISYGNFVGNPVMECDGPGGGGAGGVVALTSGTPMQNVNGGVNGTSNSAFVTQFTPNGATRGGAGVSGLATDYFNIVSRDTAICSGNSVVLNVTTEGIAPAGTISWYDAPTGGTLLATGLQYTTPLLNTTTTYYVGVCPGHFRQPLTVAVGNPMISGTAVITDVTCGAGGSVTGLAVSGGTAPMTYDWSGISTSGPDLTDSQTGSYTLTVTDAGGCTATSGPHTIGGSGMFLDDSNVIITPAGCDGSSTGTISGLVLTGGTNPQISWTNTSALTLDISGLAPDTYEITITEDGGCVVIESYIVPISAGPVINSVTASAAFCGQANGSLTVNASGGTGALQYSADNGTTFQAGSTITGLASANYTVVVMDQAGCTTTTTAVVGGSPAPQIDAVNTVDPTCGLSNGSITITASGGMGALTFSIDGNATQSATSGFSGLGGATYNIVVNDGNGCQATATAVLTQQGAAVIGAGPDQTVCAGSSVTLSGSGGISYSWSGGVSNGLPFTPAATATYTVNGVDANGCTGTDQVIVTVNALPIAVVTPSVATGCAPLSVNFFHTFVGATSCSWQFSDGSAANDCGNQSVIFTTPGCHDLILTITDAQGCTGITTVNDITCVTPGPQASFLPDPAIVTTDNPQSLMINTSTNADAWYWDFGDGSTASTDQNPAHDFPAVAGVYTVTLTASNSVLACHSDTTVEVIVMEAIQWAGETANVFTPDGDGVNDKFAFANPTLVAETDFQLIIFNRWGEIVFETQKPSDSWDGTSKGVKVSEGVYFYKIAYHSLKSGKPEQLTGPLTVIY